MILGALNLNGVLGVVEWVGRCAGVIVVLGTLCSFIRTGAWVIRVWDFPRAQCAAVGAVSLVVIALSISRHGQAADWALGVVLLGALLAQLVLIAPYTRWAPKRVPSSGEADLTLMIANIDFTNTRFAQVHTAIEAIAPDLLLLIEVNRAW